MAATLMLQGKVLESSTSAVLESLNCTMQLQHPGFDPWPTVKVLSVPCLYSRVFSCRLRLHDAAGKGPGVSSGVS